MSRKSTPWKPKPATGSRNSQTATRASGKASSFDGSGMQFTERFRRRWKWLLPLLVLLPSSLFSASILEAYFHHVELPGLSATKPAGTVIASCSEHISVIPERAPRDCKLAHVERGPLGEVHETFYFDDGSRFTLESHNGQWKSSSTSCTTLQRQGWLSFAGLLLLMIARVSHSIRTGQFLSFSNTKQHSLNDFEFVIGIYGACLLAGSIVGIFVAKCSAMSASF